MKIPRLILMGGMLVAAVAWSAAADRPLHYVSDLASSHVVVEGTSTLHDWEAAGAIEGSMRLQALTLEALWTDGNRALQQSEPVVEVRIPVDAIESGKRGLDRKLRDALQAQDHPDISYQLTAAHIRNVQDQAHLTLDTEGVLTVAGVTQAVTVPMRLERLEANRYRVTGSTTLRMTAFGVSPPKAMMGTIRAGDEVTVRWTWVIQPSP